MDDQLRKMEVRLDILENKIDHITNILGIKSVDHHEKEKPKIDLPPPLPKVESQPAINLLPLLAVICFGLAGVFIVKLAIESGWLTPERQWGLLTLFGILLSGIGLLFEKTDKAYRSYIGAAGVIVLYLAAYSSFLYFNIFPATIAQVLGALISLFCFYLFKYYQTEFFVVVCTIGTYISPILLSKESDLIYLSGFFLIWAALFSRISIYLKSRSLVLLSSYFGIGVFTFLNITRSYPQDLLIIILVQSMQFIIFAGGVFYYSLKNKDHLSKTEAISYLPILLFFYGTTYYFLSKYNPLIAPWISLGFAGFIYLLYWQAKKAILNLESQNLVQSFFAVVLFHSGYLQLVPSQGKPWLLPLIILAIYISEQKKRFQTTGPILTIFFFCDGGH